MFSAFGLLVAILEKRSAMFYLIAIAATEVLAPAPALATAVPIIETAQPHPLNDAALLINAGRFDEAYNMLITLEKQGFKNPEDENQAQFLLGLLGLQAKDYTSAIRHFRRILISDPKSVRVRLELGRTYYLSGDYYNAERQFRFARAGKLPPTVLANIDSYLRTIRSLKTLSYNFSLAIAPDSNLNAGPATDTITLYGLPFQLNQSAKAQSGVGLSVDTGIEWAPRLTNHLKLRTGAQLHLTQYRNTEFDDMTLSAYAGPHFTIKKWDLSLIGNAARRWYGNRVYSNSIGVGANATYFINSRLGVGTAIDLNRIYYALNSEQNGVGKNVAVNLFYTPTTASIIRASASLGRRNAKNAVYANHSQQFGLSYSHELKGGFTLGLSPNYTHIAYQAPLAAFNTTRIDRQYTAQVSVLNRRLDWGGFTPRIVYTRTHNDSSIQLYSFRRNRVEFGMTRSF
jgi:outer membrane protein